LGVWDITFLKEKRFMIQTMETVTIPKQEFESMKKEIQALRSSKIYQRLLEFESNISKGKKYTRQDLGF